MARLLTNGFEAQGVVNTAANDPEGQSFSIGGDQVPPHLPAITTSVVRSGAAAMVASGQAQFTYAPLPGSATGRTYYARVYFRRSGTPSTLDSVLWFSDWGSRTSCSSTSTPARSAAS
jgi:hypothetical protein